MQLQRIIDKYTTKFRWARVRLQNVLPGFSGVPYIYISPFYILFIIFWLFPVLYLFYLSFFEYIGPADGTLLSFDLGIITFSVPRISNLNFVGLENYQTVITDELFIKSVINTITIVIVEIPIMISIALLTALILNSDLVTYSRYFRTVIVLPVSANTVAYSSVFLLIFAEQFGILNFILNTVGLPAIPWRTNGWWAKISIVTSLNWRWMGYNMLILFAGLQGINEKLYEAAEMDGATRWQKFRYITLPQLRPVLLFVIIISTISGLRLFTEPWIITQGGPTNETLTIMIYIYHQGFRFFNLGYASAATFLLVIIITALAIIQLRFGRKTL